jgi:hypothetical protein
LYQVILQGVIGKVSSEGFNNIYVKILFVEKEAVLIKKGYVRSRVPITYASKE